MYRFAALFLVLILSCTVAMAQDISNPRSLIFVGDQSENLIDVISVNTSEVVYRIETSIHPDHILATPFAPILIYSDVAAKKMVFYDLQNKIESKIIDLPLVPRNMVMDTSGSKIGISDDVDGGFALVFPFDQRVEFSLKDFPPSPAVLFDPNEVELYYSNGTAGSIGILNINTEERYEIPVTDDGDQELTAPSRSLDGRYIYIGNVSTGEVYSLNAYSGAIFRTFDVGGTLARPYTTPEGVFLYMMDRENGRMVTIEQHGFTQYADVSMGQSIDLVTVGRFDHLNLFASSETSQWSIYDNIKKEVTKQGEFSGRPIGAAGSADGKFAYVALEDSAEVAVVNLEKGSVDYIAATDNGSGAFTLGLSNNVCH